MRMAVAGKGGSGKSLISGTLARVMARTGRRVLVLDSDPVPGLAISLGLGPRAEAMLADAVEPTEKGRYRLKKGIGPARAVQRFSLEGPDGVRLLQFGKATSKGLSQSLPSVHGFLHVVTRLASSDVLRDWVIIGDLPAGPRHPAYGWSAYAHTYLIVVEPTWQSILTARRVARIARLRDEAEVAFVANKVSSPDDRTMIAERLSETVMWAVPRDDDARDADRRGVALIDHAPGSAAVAAIEGLAEELLRRTMTPEVHS